jgi:hypothetical protein
LWTGPGFETAAGVERGANGARNEVIWVRLTRRPIGILALGGHQVEVERMGAGAGRTDQGEAACVAVDASHAYDALLLGHFYLDGGRVDEAVYYTVERLVSRGFASACGRRRGWWWWCL